MPFAIDTGPLHPTTEACLTMLQRLSGRQDFSNILEIGCGNGILSLAAAHIWSATVLAVDISTKAVADTERAIAEYGNNAQITTLQSDGFLHPQIRKKAPYDLIICNLLADTVLSIALDINKTLIINGYLLLSGVLAWRGQEIEQTFLRLGFQPIENNEFLSWRSYIFQKLSPTNKQNCNN